MDIKPQINLGEISLNSFYAVKTLMAGVMENIGVLIITIIIPELKDLNVVTKTVCSVVDC